MKKLTFPLGKWLCLSMILCLTACAPSPEKVIAKERAKAEAKMTAVANIAEQVRENKPLLKASITLSGPPPSFAPSTEKTNAIVMAPDHFAGLPADFKDFHINYDKPLANLPTLLKDGKLADGNKPDNGPAVKAMFELLADLRYILVVRVHQFRAPVVQGLSFRSGFCSGEVQLYDVQSGTLLGGFPFQAQNSESVDLVQENAYLFLHNNLRNNAIALIRDEFKRLYPDANPPLKRE